MRFVRSTKRGQGLTEYLLLVGLVAMGTVGAVRAFGGSVERAFASAVAHLGHAPLLTVLPAEGMPPARWVTPGAEAVPPGPLAVPDSNLAGEPVGSVTLSWTPPRTNEDGSPANDLAGYRIYYGPRSGVYGQVADIGLVSKHRITGLDVGRTYYFSITAYDSHGNESALSNEVAKTVEHPGNVR